jgi:enamine deaminase RidA (YjgF/YER057c/UK114 family)
MGKIEERLQEMGEILPAAKTPVANYLGCKRSGDILYVSARVSETRGVVGADINLEEAQATARNTMLLILAIVKESIGNLDLIASVEYMQGFVRSASDFIEQPQVLNGASDLLIDLFGEAGRHARTATGVNQLPYGAAVQLTMILRLKS